MTNQTCRNLIDALLSERHELTGIEIPDDEAAQFRLYRSLVNIRPADSASAEYLSAEDAFLQEMTRRKKTHEIEVICNVFSEKDFDIYQRLLG